MSQRSNHTASKHGEVFLDPADTRHPTQCCAASSDHNLPAEGSFGGDCFNGFNGLIQHDPTNLDICHVPWLWDRSQSPQLSSDLRAWSMESELLIICRGPRLLQTRPFLLSSPLPQSVRTLQSTWPRSSKYFLKRRLSAASLAASSWHLDLFPHRCPAEPIPRVIELCLWNCTWGIGAFAAAILLLTNVLWSGSWPGRREGARCTYQWLPNHPPDLCNKIFQNQYLR